MTAPAPPAPPIAPPITVPPVAPSAPPTGTLPAYAVPVWSDQADSGAGLALAATSASSPGAIEQVVRAHQALAAAAGRIADDVISCVAADQMILVQDAEGTGLIAAFRAFRAQATLLRQTLDRLAVAPSPQPASAADASAAGTVGFAAPAIGAAISSAIKAGDALALPLKHMAALVQSRVSGLEARLVHADEAALVAQVARRLRDAGRHVLYPRVLPLELRDPMPALAAIAALVDAAVAAMDAAASRVAALAGQQKTAAAADLAPLASAVTQLRRQLFVTPDSSPAPTDARALIEGADRVLALDRNAVLFSVQIAGTGSSPRPATLFHWKPAYTAGAVVTYFVATGDAVLLRSGTVAEYSSFREPASF